MINNRHPFHMQMRREPIFRSQMIQKLRMGRTSKLASSTWLSLLSEKWLFLEEEFQIAEVVDSTWPIVRHDDVQWKFELLEAKYVHIARMVSRTHRIFVVWRVFKMALKFQVEIDEEVPSE